MKKKRNLPFVLCFLMVLSFSLVAFADGQEEPVMIFSGGKEATEEHMEEAKKQEKMYTWEQVKRLKEEGYTFEEPPLIFSGGREATEEHMEEAKKHRKPELPAGAKALLNRRQNLPFFRYYGQETNHSCGPACIRMALRYLTGTDYGEAEIYNGCLTGTYLRDMARYINTKQSVNPYVQKYQVSRTEMKNDLSAGINVYNAPPIVGIRELTRNGWPYDLGKHFVTVYGVGDNQSSFSICDPWAGYVGDSSNRWYRKSADVLYQAYSLVNLGYMY
ncbi:hypothetical protein HMPREF1987_01329 [Peptostreptococcaceae bacterium oral taxon 113 str. W5053]|nr:hypothetical protein HMPREF1987_01329 [Peptostreptococcaceae bacterium oral taxon 113 str. W5053]